LIERLLKHLLVGRLDVKS